MAISWQAFSKKKKTSPTFQTLPQEMRDKIYEYVLLEINCTKLKYNDVAILSLEESRKRFTKPYDFEPTSKYTTGLFTVNKQISREALHFFYNRNSFIWVTLTGTLLPYVFERFVGDGTCFVGRSAFPIRKVDETRSAALINFPLVVTLREELYQSSMSASFIIAGCHLLHLSKLVAQKVVFSIGLDFRTERLHLEGNSTTKMAFLTMANIMASKYKVQCQGDLEQGERIALESIQVTQEESPESLVSEIRALVAEAEKFSQDGRTPAAYGILSLARLLKAEILESLIKRNDSMRGLTSPGRRTIELSAMRYMLFPHSQNLILESILNPNYLRLEGNTLGEGIMELKHEMNELFRYIHVQIMKIYVDCDPDGAYEYFNLHFGDILGDRFDISEFGDEYALMSIAVAGAQALEATQSTTSHSLKADMERHITYSLYNMAVDILERTKDNPLRFTLLSDSEIQGKIEEVRSLPQSHYKIMVPPDNDV